MNIPQDYPADAGTQVDSCNPEKGMLHPGFSLLQRANGSIKHAGV